MRKEFDTGQTKPPDNLRQSHSLSHRLVAFLLCTTMLGTLYMQSPTIAAANEVTDSQPSGQSDYPLSTATASSSVDDSSERVVDQSEVETTEQSKSITTGTLTSTEMEVSDGSQSVATASSVSPTNVSAETTTTTVATTASTTKNPISSTSTPVVETPVSAPDSSTIDDITPEGSSSHTAATTTVGHDNDKSSSVRPVSTTAELSTDSKAGITSEISTGSTVYAPVSDDNMMQFDRTKCTPVAGGSYYCQQTDDSETKDRTSIPDGVHALPDSGGDLEIFLVREGEFTQLTFNTVDDAAPAYDPISNTVVWHRSVSDRYQIMVYEFDTETEQQLTNDAVNNMQPVRSGDYIAWQRWVDNNWQIMLHDGNTTNQLTFSKNHNIAPVIRGNYLLWKQQHGIAKQTVEVYDLQTKQQYSINDPDGGAISNPRMMLLYESEFANGDVVTRGLDLETNEIVPIQGTPIPLPENIPNPEPLNEVRALITKTTDEDDEFEGDVEPVDTNASSSPVTTAEAGDLDLLNLSTSTTATSSDTNVVADEFDINNASSTLDLRIPESEDHVTEYDVFVPPFIASSTAATTSDAVDVMEASDNLETASSTTRTEP